MTSSPLLEDLLAAATPPPPRGFEPGVKYVGSRPDEITTPPMAQLNGPDDFSKAVREMGVPIPEGCSLVLIEARLNTGAWARDVDDKGAPHTAYRSPSWVYRFKVVASTAVVDADLTALFASARRRVTKRPISPTSPTRTMVVVLGDFQVGKVDSLGGIEELIARNLSALGGVMQRARKLKPAEIVLVDVGDGMEMFESAPNAARTNDLQFTEQLRVWRRIFWGWVAELAKLGVPLKVMGVPSNHCRVRRGKDALGPANDDLGLEVISQLADMAKVNPEAYGHVEFHVPHKYDEHLALTLASGKVLGAFHGHQKSSVNALVGWLEGQSAGRSPIGHADIVVAGHFHNLRQETWGDDRWLFVAPTMDSGSSWFTNLSGKCSRAGVLTFTVDEDGWDDWKPIWTS